MAAASKRVSDTRARTEGVAKTDSKGYRSEVRERVAPYTHRTGSEQRKVFLLQDAAMLAVIGENCHRLIGSRIAVSLCVCNGVLPPVCGQFRNQFAHHSFIVLRPNETTNFNQTTTTIFMASRISE